MLEGKRGPGESKKEGDIASVLLCLRPTPPPCLLCLLCRLLLLSRQYSLLSLAFRVEDVEIVDVGVTTGVAVVVDLTEAAAMLVDMLGVAVKVTTMEGRAFLIETPGPVKMN